MIDPRPGDPTEGTDFWQAVEPPLPSEAEWERVRTAIANRCLVRPRPVRRNRDRLAAAALAVVAGLVAVGIWSSSGSDRDSPTPRPAPTEGLAVAPAPRSVPDPLAEFAVLPVASAEDVWVESVRGHQPDWMIAADYPAAGGLTLACPDDLILLEVSPPAGRSEATAVILAGRP